MLHMTSMLSAHARPDQLKGGEMHAWVKEGLNGHSFCGKIYQQLSSLTSYRLASNPGSLSWGAWYTLTAHAPTFTENFP